MGEQRRGAATAVFALAIAAGAALVSFRATYEPDLWWHLAQGRETAAGRLVRTNLFSFSFSDYPQPYTSWLFDLGSYLVWTHAGAAALQAVQAGIIGLTLWSLAAACRVRSSVAATVAVCVFGWLILEPRALPRPHVLSFLGFALCVLMIERARWLAAARPLLWSPLLVAVWGNVHVECVFGVALVGLFGIGEYLRPRSLPRREALRVLGFAGLSVIATAANPYGIGLLRYLYENAFVPQVINIAELLPPYLPAYRAFFAWAIAGGLAVLLMGRRLAIADLLMIAPFAYLGFSHLRLTPLLLLASAPLVARAIDHLAAFRIEPRAVAATTAAAAIVLARVPLSALPGEIAIGRAGLMPAAFFSEAAMQYAREHDLKGPVFTSMNLGGFVAWELYPSARVFVDSRLQAYPPAYFRTIIEASRDPRAWAAITAGVDWAVLSLPKVNELSGVGQFTAPGWRSVYRDRAIEIVVRR